MTLAVTVLAVALHRGASPSSLPGSGLLRSRRPSGGWSCTPQARYIAAVVQVPFNLSPGSWVPSLVTTAAATRALDISPAPCTGYGWPGSRFPRPAPKTDTLAGMSRIREQVTTHFDTLGRSKSQD